VTETATVLNIQRFTLHDGPGIRTELFLKGCPLRCAWCGNPESFNRNIELGIVEQNCISSSHCDACSEVCPSDSALLFTQGKLVDINRDECSNCLQCIDECPSDAIKPWGEELSVEQCMQIILRDQGFYQRSGGGVTVSGGEPLLQHKFVLELFKACKKHNIHTCLETSLYVNWNRVAELLPFTDLVISDIKLIDSIQHKRHTGVDNQKILQNLSRLSQSNKPIILRVPVIPTINDDPQNMKATADFIIQKMKGNINSLQLLSFMRLGEEKYASLGRSYPMKDLSFDRFNFQKRVNDMALYFNTRGINCLVGTKQKQSE
jgi:pyruvate formate lyase activating enzyme